MHDKSKVKSDPQFNREVDLIISDKTLTRDQIGRALCSSLHRFLCRFDEAAART